MSAQSTHVGTVITAIDGLGYVLSKDMFDFEAVPSSVMDKAYRFSVATNAVNELSGNRIEKDKTLELWMAYKLTAGGNRKTAVLAMLDSIEAVEDQLLHTLTTLPKGMVIKTAMSKYVENYIVFNVTFDFTYWRDI
jgi:hypothetical protein